jgi:hypothetical protein
MAGIDETCNICYFQMIEGVLPIRFTGSALRSGEQGCAINAAETGGTRPDSPPCRSRHSLIPLLSENKDCSWLFSSTSC